MATSMAGLWSVTSDAVEKGTQAEQAGSALAGVAATGVLLWIWLFGALITGGLAVLTRGGKTVTTETVRE
jgi:hypothetical protein